MRRFYHQRLSPGMPLAQQEMQQQQNLGVTPFGSNNASGPNADTAIGAGATAVPWQTLAVGAAGNTVACTGKSSGRFRVVTTIGVKNTTGAAINVQAQLQLNGANVAGAVAQATVAATTGVAALTIVWTLNELAAALAAQTPQTFGVVCTGNGATITANQSFIDIQEQDVATG